MQGSLDAPPIIVRGGRARGIVVVISFAMMMALSALAFVAPEGIYVGLGGLVLFGLPTLLGVWMIAAPPALEIGPAGITQRYLWWRKAHAWADILDIRPVPLGLGQAVSLTTTAAPTGMQQLGAVLSGQQATLGGGWEIKPPELAALLNQARARWQYGGAAAPASAMAGAPMAVGAAPARGLAIFAGGRLSRWPFLIAWAVILAVGFALSFIPGRMSAVSTVLGVLGIRLFAARLHDLGRSGWWQLTLYGLQIGLVFGCAALDMDLDVAVGLAVLPQLLLIAVLGAWPGQPIANKFGPPSGRSTATATAEAFR